MTRPLAVWLHPRRAARHVRRVEHNVELLILVIDRLIPAGDGIELRTDGSGFGA